MLSGEKRAMPEYMKLNLNPNTFNPDGTLVSFVEEMYVLTLPSIVDGGRGFWELIRPTLDKYNENSKEVTDVENERIARAYLANAVDNFAHDRGKLRLTDKYKISPHFIHIVDVARSVAAKYPPGTQDIYGDESEETFKTVGEEIAKTLIDEYFDAMRVPSEVSTKAV